MAIIGFAIALLAPTAAANAATVTNTNDSGPGSLRQAIIDAAPGEKIQVPAGKYVLTSGELQFDKSLSIEGDGPGRTIVSGNKRSRVFVVENGETEDEVTIAGMTIREGRLDKKNQSDFRDGAAISFFNLGDLKVDDLLITENVAAGNLPGESAEVQGGAFSFAAGHLEMTDTKVTHNLIRMQGREAFIDGGAVLSSAASMHIDRVTIADNVAEAIGGDGPGEKGEVFGAGITTAPGTLPEEEGGPMLVSNSTISGNRAIAAGGPNGERSWAQGAGVFFLASGATDNSLVQDTIVNNEAVAGSRGGAVGGGLAMVSGIGTSALAVSNSTIASNSVRGLSSLSAAGNLFKGGFVHFLGSHDFDGGTHMTLSDTIVSGGSGGAVGTQNCLAERLEGKKTEPFTSLGFNLDSTQQCGFNAPGDLRNTDPLLGPLADNGGPTQTMLPAANSPAVDQGTRNGLVLDQRGMRRTFDVSNAPNSTVKGADGTDVGAVEVQGSDISPK